MDQVFLLGNTSVCEVCIEVFKVMQIVKPQGWNRRIVPAMPRVDPSRYNQQLWLPSGRIDGGFEVKANTTRALLTITSARMADGLGL